MESDKLLGQTINGYQILRHIARGGMANVYVARHHGLKRDVAMKVMLADYLESRSFVERFNREAHALARLNHPNIVHVYDTGILPDGRPYFTMQLVKGGSLERRLEQLATARQIMTVPQALLLARQIAAAVQYVHNAEIVHRDLKPSNILIDEQGQPILTDLGIAFVQDDQRLTRTSIIMGTPHYMSPEQGKGRTLDIRSDIYSLGVMLFELLAGRRPFEGDSLALVYQHVNEPPPSLGMLRPGLAKYTQQVVGRCLEKDPSRRFQSAGELVAALEGALAAETGAPMPAAAVSPVWAASPMPAGTSPGSPTGPMTSPMIGRTGPMTSPMTGQTRPVMPTTPHGTATQKSGSTWLLAVLGVAAVALIAMFAWPSSPPEPTSRESSSALISVDATDTPISNVVDESPTSTAVASNAGAVQATEEAAEERAAEAATVATARPGTTSRAVTTATAAIATPDSTEQQTVSTNGSAEIAFQSNRDGDFEIYIMNTDGSNVRKLTDNFVDDLYPRVSPDGRRILFESERDGNFEIYVMNRDGSEQTRLTFNEGRDGQPTWSPDGKQIAFHSTRATLPDVYVMDTDGSNLRQITNTPQMREGHTSWSIDGELIYNASQSNYWQIYASKADGSGTRRITNSTYDEWSPEWSADGKQILFLSEIDSRTNSGVYIMQADGSSPRLVYNGPGEEWGAIWSGDGSYIIFTAEDPPDTHNLYRVGVNGSGFRRLVERASYPAWAPPVAGRDDEVSASSVATFSAETVIVAVPTLAPTATFVPVATATPLPPPTPAPVVCRLSPGPRWGPTMWDRNKDRLGCAITDEIRTNAAAQLYQGGLTVWREDRDRVYVLYNDGSYQTFPGDAGPQGYRHSDLLKGAFGYLWNNNSSVRDRLGQPKFAEFNATRFAVQDFEGGVIFYFYENDARNYALIADTGRWTSAQE